MGASPWQGEDRTGRGGNCTLGSKLRVMLAAYVHCLALGGDLLMSDVCTAGALEVCCSVLLSRFNMCFCVFAGCMRVAWEGFVSGLAFKDVSLFRAPTPDDDASNWSVYVPSIV